MTQQPQALEVGQVWVATRVRKRKEPERRIAKLFSDAVFYVTPARGTMYSTTWTDWRDWQQRHAARVQGGRDGE